MKLLFWRKPISTEKSFKVKSDKYELPFYRKYPNDYLNFIGMYKISDLDIKGILRKFRIYRIKYMPFNGKMKSSIIVIPIKENPNWREQFRTINKSLSFNYN